MDVTPGGGRAPRARPAAAIEVHVEELILEGFPPMDRQQVGEAVRREVLRLLEEGLPAGLAAGRAIDRVDAGWFEPPSMHPAAIGTALARAVHQGLRQ
jgi:hypothetical protein